MICHRAMRRIGAVFGFRIQIIYLRFFTIDIDGYPDVNRRWTPGRCHTERAAHQKRDLLCIRQDEGFLGDAVIQFRLINPCQTMLLVLIDRNVRAEIDDRNRTEVSFGHSRCAMRHAWAWGLEHRWTTGDLGIGLGRVRCGSLVTGQNKFNVAVFAPLLVPANCRLAGKPEHMLHAMQLQHFQNDLRPVHSYGFRFAHFTVLFRNTLIACGTACRIF